MKVYVVQALGCCVQPIGVFSTEEAALACAQKLAKEPRYKGGYTGGDIARPIGYNSVIYGYYLDDDDKALYFLEHLELTQAWSERVEQAKELLSEWFAYDDEEFENLAQNLLSTPENLTVAQAEKLREFGFMVNKDTIQFALYHDFVAKCDIKNY